MIFRWYAQGSDACYDLHVARQSADIYLSGVLKAPKLVLRVLKSIEDHAIELMPGARVGRERSRCYTISINARVDIPDTLLALHSTSLSLGFPFLAAIIQRPQLFRAQCHFRCECKTLCKCDCKLTAPLSAVPLFLMSTFDLCLCSTAPRGKKQISSSIVRGLLFV